MNSIVKQGCRICGVVDGTRSHLIPASMIKDARGNDNSLTMGTRFADGRIDTQSGLWDDDILCLEHEKMLGEIDRKAVEFTRDWRNKSLILKPASFTIENVDTDMLVRFAASVIWRCSVSNRFGMHMFKIGRSAEKRIEDILFRGAPVADFPRVSIMGIRSVLPYLDGLVYFPKLIRKAEIRIVRFVVSTIVFTVDIAPRPFKKLDPININGKSVIETGFIPYEDTVEFQGVVNTVPIMERPRARWPQRGKSAKRKSV